MPEEGKVYELFIIGGGPAGLTAGIYAARSRINTVLFERLSLGGQAATTDLIENYPGFPEGISGTELAQRMEEQATRFGLEISFDEVESISLDGDLKVLKTTEGEYRAKSVIVASGWTAKKLGVEAEERLTGRGVSYCATCDGAFFAGRDVLVIGGGDAAVEEAIYLTRFARKVTIVHRRDQLRAAKIAQEKAFANDKIDFLWDSVVKDILGTNKVEGARIQNVKTGQEQDVEADGIFIYIGVDPNTRFLPPEIQKDQNGFILANEELETNVPGIFVAGDVRQKALRQVATAVGDGAIAAMSVEKYLGQ